MARAPDLDTGLSELNSFEVKKPIITNDQGVDAVVSSELGDIAREAFMNEIVEITVTTTGAENEEPHFTLDVNNRKQTFFRDVPTPCRRMFAEVLARCKKTNYVQKVDAHDMTRQELVGTTAFVYPFSMDDRNPRGQAWLRAVRAEAN